MIAGPVAVGAAVFGLALLHGAEARALPSLPRGETRVWLIVQDVDGTGDAHDAGARLRQRLVAAGFPVSEMHGGPSAVGSEWERAAMADYDFLVHLEWRHGVERVLQGRYVVEDHFQLQLLDTFDGDTRFEREGTIRGRSVQNYDDAHQGALDVFQQEDALDDLLAELESERARLGQEGVRYQLLLHAQGDDALAALARIQDPASLLASLEASVEGFDLLETTPERWVRFRSASAPMQVATELLAACTTDVPASVRASMALIGRTVVIEFQSAVRASTETSEPTAADEAAYSLESEVLRAAEHVGRELAARGAKAGFDPMDAKVSPLLLPDSAVSQGLGEHARKFLQELREDGAPLGQQVEWEREGVECWERFSSTGAGRFVGSVFDQLQDAWTKVPEPIAEAALLGLELMGQEDVLFGGSPSDLDQRLLKAVVERGVERILVPRLSADPPRVSLQVLGFDLGSGVHLRVDVQLGPEAEEALGALLHD